MDEDEVEDPDESLVVDGGEESWMSEKAPAISVSPLPPPPVVV